MRARTAAACRTPMHAQNMASAYLRNLRLSRQTIYRNISLRAQNNLEKHVHKLLEGTQVPCLNGTSISASGWLSVSQVLSSAVQLLNKSHRNVVQGVRLQPDAVQAVWRPPLLWPGSKKVRCMLVSRQPAVPSTTKRLNTCSADGIFCAGCAWASCQQRRHSRGL